MDPIREEITDITMILQQAPDGTTSEQALQVLQETDGDFSKALAKLWGVEEPVEKPRNKWEKMREVCNTLSQAAHEMLSKKK